MQSATSAGVQAAVGEESIAGDAALRAAERLRLACELHDAISQTLFAAHLMADSLSRDATLEEQPRAQAQALAGLAQGAMAQLRLLTFELRPQTLWAMPWADLLQQAAAALAVHGRIAIAVHCAPVEPPPAVRIELYRLVQEALLRVSRRSGVHHVHLRWQAEEGRGRLSWRDDGPPRPGYEFPVLDKADGGGASSGVFQRRIHEQGDGFEIEVSWAAAPARGSEAATPKESRMGA
jgi:signal transduction histidine kinase